MAEIVNTTTNQVYDDWQEVCVVISVPSETRESALANMNEQAAQMGADAVVGVRFDSVVKVVNAPLSDTGYGTEYVAYGTAVKLAYPTELPARLRQNQDSQDWMDFQDFVQAQRGQARRQES